MASSSPVFFLIADITGYTRFMRAHSEASSHAREITVRLLRAIVNTSGSPLRVAEIEGDAVFFYAPSGNSGLSDVVASLQRQIIGFFRAFNAEVSLLKAMDVCSCEACSSVGSLRLKQVVHLGEATDERVSRFDKLFSLDVILVHRLLKSAVEGRQYVLMTAPAYDAFGRFFDLIPEVRHEDVEGLGPTETYAFHGDRLSSVIATVPARSLSWDSRGAHRFPAPASSVPSLTAMVIAALPCWPAAGIKVRVRSSPVPSKRRPPAARRTHRWSRL